jgi:hypothetical protein
MLAPSPAQRNRDQATLLLVGHAWIGDTGRRISWNYSSQNLVRNSAEELRSAVLSH